MAPELYDLVASALKNAEENGDGDRIRGMSIGHQASDLLDCDAEIGCGDYLFDDVVEALVEYRLKEKPKDLPKILNQVQFEGLKHRLLDPVHAIRYALSDDDEGMQFLHSWNEGDWKMCAYCWPAWKDFR